MKRSRPLLSRSGCIYKKEGKMKTEQSSRPLLSRSGCISYQLRQAQNKAQFSSPFIEERLYLRRKQWQFTTLKRSRPLLSRSGCILISVWIPIRENTGSRPLLSRSGCISNLEFIDRMHDLFSSPFIEERLYLKRVRYLLRFKRVLVPFYRGAVVFDVAFINLIGNPYSSRPLLSRSGCICRILEQEKWLTYCSRPLLSRSGCIWRKRHETISREKRFSSPFIEERLYLTVKKKWSANMIKFSSPFIEERLYLMEQVVTHYGETIQFSSPFIEERLYL